ncbi:GntR family transcriptional regulator [Salsuginibacillus halophilus]|uniref:GntR family transcriptional regulator n=1 Tax=Salsuginibacillus halophilus TaxID=517424 RepID=A0A2P8HL91_9BACI|nr:GntR family transcriptional regulator [Salsuginibacillus halophilus]PSL46988.1 GntR family transcriptional regulator [Salsuginibacillus halophilus]
MRKIYRAESLTEQAYRLIKDSIINTEVEPMEELAEEKIAGELGISRTPIREALKQLAFEGLVELRKGTKARVSSVSPEEALDYQLLREQLEAMAAKYAAKHATENDVAHLKDVTNKQHDSIKDGDFHRFIDLDYEFHHYIAVLSQNKKLQEFTENLNSQVQRFLILTQTLTESVTQAVNEHLAIIEAIESHDGSLAEVQMKTHIERVTKRIFGSVHFEDNEEEK